MSRVSQGIEEPPGLVVKDDGAQVPLEEAHKISLPISSPDMARGDQRLMKIGRSRGPVCETRKCSNVP
jgi:hypothetical protein